MDAKDTRHGGDFQSKPKKVTHVEIALRLSFILSYQMLITSQAEIFKRSTNQYFQEFECDELSIQIILHSKEEVLYLPSLLKRSSRSPLLTTWLEFRR
jgi:hypothetical protein